MYECSKKGIFLKTNGKCAYQAGWKKAHFGQYLCCSRATTSFMLMTKILCVAGLWMIKLNKTIIVLVYGESTR